MLLILSPSLKLVHLTWRQSVNRYLVRLLQGLDELLMYNGQDTDCIINIEFMYNCRVFYSFSYSDYHTAVILD